jgi:hypothetical protein
VPHIRLPGQWHYLALVSGTTLPWSVALPCPGQWPRLALVSGPAWPDAWVSALLPPTTGNITHPRPAVTNTLVGGQQLLTNETGTITSPNGRFRLVQQLGKCGQLASGRLQG